MNYKKNYNPNANIFQKCKSMVKKKHILWGLFIIVLIFAYKRIDRFFRLHPAKPKLRFNQPIALDLSEPDPPIVNSVDPMTVVYSIIVPLYSSSGSNVDVHKVQRCLDSMRYQKGQLPRADFVLKSEIIVVYDDTSGINSIIETCRLQNPPPKHERELGYDCAYPHSAVRFIKTPNNEGLSGHLNFGVQHSTGVWVMPVDIEDQIHPLLFAHVSLAFDSQGGLSPTQPGKYNVIMPTVMDFDRKPLAWQPSANTSTIYKQNMLHGSGLFLRATWESGIQYSSLMLYGWQDWDFWVKLESKIGLTVLIVEKPLFKYNITHHRSGICQANREVCIALLYLNNPCVYKKENVLLSFKVIREFIETQKGKSNAQLIWDIVGREAARGNAFARLMIDTRYSGTPTQTPFAIFHKTSCPEEEKGVCEVAQSRLNQLAEAQEGSFDNKMTLFHVIVITTPEEAVWKHVLTHVVVSALDLHPQATVVVHSNINLADLIGEKVMGFYGSRVMSMPIKCHKGVAASVGMTKISNHMLRYSAGRTFENDQMSDYLRLLLMYAFGGIHLDTDMLLRQPVDNLHNAAALEASGKVNGGFMTFDRFNPVMKHCLEQIPILLNPFKRGSIGSDLITKASKIYSYELTEDEELMFNVLPKHTFYKSSFEELAYPHVTQPQYNQRGLNGELGYHIQGHQLHVKGDAGGRQMSSYSVLGHTFRDSCNPDIMTCVELDNMV